MSKLEKEYTLYLDESKTVDNIFVIGGFCVLLDKEKILKERLDALKKKIWKNGDNTKVFHATDYIKRYPNVFLEMIDIVRDVEGKVFATVIKLDELSELFGRYYNAVDDNNYKFIDDVFNIALAKVIENYTHFLYFNNAFGKTMYESRNNDDQKWLDSPDYLLKKDYLKIIANSKGMSYINDEALRLCNTNFSVKQKKEDVAGLQIADNIAFVIARSMSPSLKENKEMDKIFDEIFYLSYNGGFKLSEKDLRHFYGIKILPEMFRTVPMERKGKEQEKYYINAIKELENKLSKIQKDNNINNK